MSVTRGTVSSPTSPERSTHLCSVQGRAAALAAAAEGGLQAVGQAAAVAEVQQACLVRGVSAPVQLPPRRLHLRQLSLRA